jgi:hypothetical protein
MKRLQAINVIVGLALLSGLAYCSYSYLTAASRVRATCAAIPLGANPTQLLQFASAHGLTRPAGDYTNAVHTFTEIRSFGRFGCRVSIRNSVVASVDYESTK